MLQQALEAVERAGLWDELGSDWLVLDGELMPWSLKAEALIKDTYASMAASAIAATDASVAVLERATGKVLTSKDFSHVPRHATPMPKRSGNPTYAMSARMMSCALLPSRCWPLRTKALEPGITAGICRSAKSSPRTDPSCLPPPETCA